MSSDPEGSGVRMCARRDILWVISTLLALITPFASTAGTVSSVEACSGSESGAQRPPFPSDAELKKDFDDDDLKAKDDKPGGKWGCGTLLDSKRDDPSAPAYVSGIQLLSGGEVSRDT
jgi:hypothetical protein